MINLSALIDRTDAAPLYLQISEALRRAIANGELATGRKLPASRTLAQDLGVSRTTIVQAYDQLVAEGFLTSRAGSGIFVADVAPFQLSAQKRHGAQVSPSLNTPQLLQPGDPDPEIFPTLPWARCVARVARNNPTALSQLADPFGDPQLRQEIATYLGQWRGIDTTADQILVTSGAREALELALDFLGKGKTIGLETPGFAPLHRFVLDRGWPVSWLAVDAQGAVLPRELPAATVLTPSHQFPLGGTMPVARRQQFLAMAHAQGSWIIEDDFDSEFRYAGQPVPAMAALDRHGRCIYVGTFSKTFSHAIRLGYMVLPPNLVAPFRQRFIHPSAGAAITAQRPLADFMASGQYDRHIRRARRHYAERYEIAVNALQTWPAAWGRFQKHRAGMQIAFRLSGSVPDMVLVQDANTHGFALRALSSCDPDRSLQGLLIGFCRADTNQLPQDFDRLAQVLGTKLKR